MFYCSRGWTPSGCRLAARHYRCGRPRPDRATWRQPGRPLGRSGQRASEHSFDHFQSTARSSGARVARNTERSPPTGELPATGRLRSDARLRRDRRAGGGARNSNAGGPRRAGGSRLIQGTSPGSGGRAGGWVLSSTPALGARPRRRAAGAHRGPPGRRSRYRLPVPPAADGRMRIATLQPRPPSLSTSRGFRSSWASLTRPARACGPGRRVRGGGYAMLRGPVLRRHPVTSARTREHSGGGAGSRGERENARRRIGFPTARTHANHFDKICVGWSLWAT